MNKKSDYSTEVAIVLTIVVMCIPGLLEIRAIAIQDFTIVWFFLIGFIYFAVWFYLIKKSKDNLKRQILITIISLLFIAILLFIICSL